jgi:hypothetical protein
MDRFCIKAEDKKDYKKVVFFGPKKETKEKNFDKRFFMNTEEALVANEQYQKTEHWSTVACVLRNK